ncbi:MAG: PEP-CTERM sorting domain-containing protein [Pirellulaceae bacterium]|nr:PEP-CTERM sorting domain-containing protein [Pirellulaceae bacterium]
MRIAFFSVLLAVISSVASADVITSFDVDLTPGAQGFANAGAASLALDYTIDGAGNVSLDAVALGAGGGAASPARWDQVDNASAGTVAAVALFNTDFTLTFSGSANPILAYPSYGTAGTGAVLATQQGNVTALENGEFAAFTVSGSATLVSGFSLNLNSFSYDNRLANGQSSFGVEDTSGTVIEQTIPNTSSSGTISGLGISLAAGETMTFRTIAGNAGGAGLSGFDFNISTAVPEPSSAALFGITGMLTLLRRRRG